MRGPRHALGALLAGLLAIASESSAARAQPLPIRIAAALTPRGALPVRWPRAPLLFDARAAIGADVAWARPEVGARGEGAFVCVVDSGVDLSHPSFRDAAGRTRVAFLLDVAGAPRGVHVDLERAGGAVWSAAEIDATLGGGDPLPTDSFGHGTAIASAAAGDDAGLGAPGPGAGAGMAPEAGLLVVRALRERALGFEDADVVRAVDFCFEASPAPERTVALLALGGHDGAHDGTEPLEEALARHAARGRIIVVAAGNDGGRSLHAAGRAAGGAAWVDVTIPRATDGTLEHEIALVVAGASSLALLRPDGSTVGPVAAGDRAEDIGALGYALVDGSAREGVHYVVLGGGGEHAPLGAGRHRLELAAPALFDVWLLDGEIEPGAAFGARLDETHLVPSEEVTIPATSPSVLAIGASVSRASFVSDRGTPPLLVAADADGRAPFSSRGPSRSGWPRPDVLAPGALVSVALSSALDLDRRRTIFGSTAALEARLDGDDVVLAGSSIAAGVAAGALALALAVDVPPPDVVRLRAAIARSARRFGGSMAPGAPAWTASVGAGELDVVALLEALDAPSSSERADGARSRIAATREIIVPGARDVVVVAHVSDRDGHAIDGGSVTVRAGTTELGRAECVHGLAIIALAPIVATPRSRVVLDVAHDATPLGMLVLEVRADEGLRGDVRPGGGPSCAASHASGAHRPCGRGLAVLLLGIACLRAARARWNGQPTAGCFSSRAARAVLRGTCARSAVGSR